MYRTSLRQVPLSFSIEVIIANILRNLLYFLSCFTGALSHIENSLKLTSNFRFFVSDFFDHSFLK